MLPCIESRSKNYSNLTLKFAIQNIQNYKFFQYLYRKLSYLVEITKFRVQTINLIVN